MKKFYTIIIIIAALLIVQMLVTTKAYGETKMTAEEAHKYALEQKGFGGYVEQTFESYEDFLVQILKYSEAEAKGGAKNIAYLKSHGENTDMVGVAEKCIMTVVFNNDGTVVLRRYVK